MPVTRGIGRCGWRRVRVGVHECDRRKLTPASVGASLTTFARTRPAAWTQYNARTRQTTVVTLCDAWQPGETIAFIAFLALLLPLHGFAAPS
jgi:hypothetical protein